MSDIIDISQYVAFEATGLDAKGRRNTAVRAPLWYIKGLNYWFKTVWGILPNGKRKRLYTVSN